MTEIKPKKMVTGGSVLLERHGPEYFSKLRKKGWKKQKLAMKFWEEEQEKKKSAKSAKALAK